MNHADLVTEVDKASETLIIDKLETYFGDRINDYFILSEESASEKDIAQTEEISKNKGVWCIDPIDGTTNFYFGIPLSCVAIGLRYKEESILGIVYNPVSKEFFFGIKGSGSYLLNFNTTDINKLGNYNNNNHNNSGEDKNAYVSKLQRAMALSEKLETSKMHFQKIPEFEMTGLKLNNNNINSNEKKSEEKKTGDEGDISVGFEKAMILSDAIFCNPLAGKKEKDKAWDGMNILLKETKIRAIRLLGSCALSMCYVACGRSHVCFIGQSSEYGVSPWDVVAAEVIVKEAGGQIYLPDDINLKYDCTKGTVLACNNKSAATVFKQLKLYC